MKFVRTDKFGFVLFIENTDLYHSDIGNFLKGEGCSLISAGFVSFKNGKPFCHGESESLSLGLSEDDDSALIHFFQNSGLEHSTNPIEAIDTELTRLQNKLKKLENLRKDLTEILNPPTSFVEDASGGSGGDEDVPF